MEYLKCKNKTRTPLNRWLSFIFIFNSYIFFFYNQTHVDHKYMEKKVFTSPGEKEKWIVWVRDRGDRERVVYGKNLFLRTHTHKERFPCAPPSLRVRFSRNHCAAPVAIQFVPTRRPCRAPPPRSFHRRRRHRHSNRWPNRAR